MTTIPRGRDHVNELRDRMFAAMARPEPVLEVRESRHPSNVRLKKPMRCSLTTFHWLVAANAMHHISKAWLSLQRLRMSKIFLFPQCSLK